MSNIYIDPRNGHKVEVIYFESLLFSLLIGPFFFLINGMTGWFFLACLANLCTFGLAWIPLAFLAGPIHKQYLVKQGFMTKEYAKKVAENRCSPTEYRVRIDPSLN